VEATSVTPFSPRALDRALAAALVAQCRHTIPALTPARGAADISQYRADLDRVAEEIASRAREHRTDLSPTDRDALYTNVLHRSGRLLDDWVNIAARAQQEGSAIQYQKEAKSPPGRLLRDFLDPDLPNLHAVYGKFRANRSMRDVESPVEIQVQNLKDWGE
jgi:hypothetical protein